MEHTWFLTEMSKRKLAAEQSAADAVEEGPETEEEEDSEDEAPHTKDNLLLSDDDPSSPFSPISPTFAPPEASSALSDSQAGLPVRRAFVSELRWGNQQLDSMDTGPSEQ